MTTTTRGQQRRTPTPQAASNDQEGFFDDEDDALATDEAYESSKALIVNKRSQEAKALGAENQKPLLDRQRVARGFHEAFVKEKSDNLRQRRHQKRGNASNQSSVIERVKRVKKLTLSLDIKGGFEKQREAQLTFTVWRRKQAYQVDQIVAAAKKLRERNEDCKGLGCVDEQRDDEKGLSRLREKLTAGAAEAKSKALSLLSPSRRLTTTESLQLNATQ